MSKTHTAENDAPVECPTCGEWPYGCSWIPGGCCSDCPHYPPSEGK